MPTPFFPNRSFKESDLEWIFKKVVTLLDPKVELDGLWQRLEQKYKDKGMPDTVKVSTDSDAMYFGVQINAWEAYMLDQLELLGEKESEVSHGWGSTDYSRTFVWRVLDTCKLREYLGK